MVYGWNRHWSAKTGRGRLRVPQSKARGGVSKPQAKAIVKKAGPQEKQVTTSSTGTDTLFSTAGVFIPGATATGQDAIDLFTPFDYATDAGLRERVRVNSLEFRLLLNQSSNTSGAVARRYIMWWIYLGSAADVQAMIAGEISPWSSDSLVDYQTGFRVRTLRRGRFMLTSAPVDDIPALLQARSHKDLFIKYKRPFWVQEDMQVVFAYRWWTLILGDAGAVEGDLAGVVQRQDRLIRWARY